jgi:ketosteroid isomerase-like protein
MTMHEPRPVNAGTDARATSPADIIERFARYLGDRDLEALVGLYEPGAAFEVEPGTLVHGHGAIREALARFLALEPTITGEIQKVVEADGTALVVNKWRLEGTGPDGAPIRMGGLSADVMRRRPDGSWRMLIDDPWGGGGRPR